MGNKNDGKPQDHKKMEVYGDDGLELYGNKDAKELSKAYKELSKGGLTAEEIKKLENLDKILKGAEFHGLNSDGTLIKQETKNTEQIFVVLGNGHKQNAGFVKK